MSLLLLLLLASLLMPQEAWAATFATWTDAANTAQAGTDYQRTDFDGDGEEDLVINTALGLAWLAASVNGQLEDSSDPNDYQYVNVYLNADIDLAPDTGAIVTGYTANGNALPTDGTNPTVNANNSWIPIGTETNPFKGKFYGNNHTINHVYINNSIADYQGLFGSVGYAWKFENLLIANSYIYANDYVGAIAGSLYVNFLINCANEGTVIGQGDNVGGLVGISTRPAPTYTEMQMSNCYNTGNVQGSSNVGGILGIINESGFVLNIYNTGAVQGNSNVGGIFGKHQTLNFPILNIYNSGDIAGIDSSATAIGAVIGNLPASEATSLFNTYYKGGALNPIGSLNDAYENNITAMTEAEMLSEEFVALLNQKVFAQNDSTMQLWQAGQDTPPVFSAEEIVLWVDVANTAQINSDYSLYQDDSKQDKVSNLADANYIEIHNARGLAWFAASVNGQLINDSTQAIAAENYSGKTVELTADIDLAPANGALVSMYIDTGNNLPPSIAGKNSWIEIGQSTTNKVFSGIFDGNDYTISNIYINTNAASLGLFGNIEDAIVKNVNITQSNIDVEHTRNTVLNNVGAIVGYAIDSQILNCTNSGTIEGSGIVGSIDADNGNSLIDNCHNYGLLYVTEDMNQAKIGGIAGSAYQNENNQDISMIIQNCSNSGTISNQADGPSNNGNMPPQALAGGIVGQAITLKIYNCYNTGSIMASTERSYVGGIVGSLVASRDLTLNNCYNTAIPTITQYVEGRSFLGAILGEVSVSFDPSQNSIIDAQNCYYQGASGLSGLNIPPALNITDNTIAMTATQMANKSFVDTLNAWITAQASTDFMTWAQGSSSPMLYDYWPQFMPIPDIDRGDNLGGGGAAAEEPATEEASNNNQTQVDINIDPVISENNAQADIEDNDLTQASQTLLEQTAGTDSAPQLNLDINTPANAQSVEVSLSPAALAALAAKNNSSLKISTNLGHITFDNQALNSIIKQANGQKITIIIKIADNLSAEQQAAIGTNPAYQLLIKVGDTYISDFEGGLATITIPYSAVNGQVTVYHVDALGQASAKPTTYNAEDQEASFSSGHFSAFMIMEQHLPFSDVAADDWFYEAISYAYSNNLMNGLSATEFAPHAATTRAMIWTVLARLDGVDTEGGELWYSLAQAWAMANQVSDGENPEGSITREQFATMLYRYAAPAAVTTQTMLAQFSDNAATSEYAIPAMEWAVANGIISGYQDGTILAQGTATRAEIATMLMRYLEME